MCRTTFAVILGWLSLIPTLTAADDACSLLTQARVSEVLAISVASGVHASETPSGRRMCTWSQPVGRARSTKWVTLDLFGPIGRLTPAERFENDRKAVNGVTKTPVSGIGDDAFLMVSQGAGTVLLVKKGDSVFQIGVRGFSASETEALEKTLARDAVSKL